MPLEQMEQLLLYIYGQGGPESCATSMMMCIVCVKVFDLFVSYIETEKVCVRPLGFVASQFAGLCRREWCLNGWDLVYDLVFEACTMCGK